MIDGPTTYKIEGMLTAAPQTGIPGMQRVIDLRDKLIKVKERRQPVILSGESIFDVVTLHNISATMSADKGKALAISITAQSYREVKPGTTTMPPARFKPSTKPGGVAKGAAGQGTKKPVSVLGRALGSSTTVP